MKLAKRSLALALILLLLVLPAASRPQTKEDIRRSVAVKKFEDTSIFQTKPTETGWDFSRSKRLIHRGVLISPNYRFTSSGA